MKLCWKVLLVASVSLALIPQAPASSVVIREPYDAPAVLAYGGLSDCEDPVRSEGIACVSLPPAATKLGLRVRDLTDLPIGGTYYLSDASGGFVASGTFCGGASLPLDGSATMVVIRLEAVNGPLACLDEGRATGSATQGIIAVRLG